MVRVLGVRGQHAQEGDAPSFHNSYGAVKLVELVVRLLGTVRRMVGVFS